MWRNGDDDDDDDKGFRLDLKMSFFSPENSDGRDVDFLEKKNLDLYLLKKMMMKVPEFVCVSWWTSRRRWMKKKEENELKLKPMSKWHVYYLNIFELNLIEGTKMCNEDEIKGLKQTFYYLWNQNDTKKTLRDENRN